MLKYTTPITKSNTAARKRPPHIPKIEQITLSSIKPCAGNARRHDKKQIEQIAESFREFDFINPIITDERNEISCSQSIVIGNVGSIPFAIMARLACATG